MFKRTVWGVLVAALFLLPMTGMAKEDGLNIEPQEPSAVTEGFNQMSEDLAELSAGVAPVIAFAAFMIGAIMIVLGLIFSRKLTQGGFFLALAAGFVFFLLSDLSGAVAIAKGFFEKIASYF